jgi:PIN domain nuclease of toxin-antitoxin system
VKYLLDTHAVLALIWRDLPLRYPQWVDVVAETSECAASAASLWEIAIKTRTGKLDPQIPVNAIQDYLTALGFTILPVSGVHATTAATPEPSTRDPFDRLLLATAQIEGLRLVTADRALADHPAVWR